MANVKNNYISHYTSIDRVYPSAFALKVFLGRYPGFCFRNTELQGKKILDLGFGDGRDLVLFSDLGMKVYGCEPEKEVVEHRLKFFQDNNRSMDLKAGTNLDIPYEDNFFDILYSSAAMYYMPSGNNTIHEAFAEANRVMKLGAYLVGSLVSSRAHYIPSAEKLSNNIYKLTDPFFNQRNGQHIHAYNTESELEADLKAAGFSDIRIGKFEADWFGIHESLFMVICQKNK